MKYKDLQLDAVDVYFVHWLFPNYHFQQPALYDYCVAHGIQPFVWRREHSPAAH